VWKTRSNACARPLQVAVGICKISNPNFHASRDISRCTRQDVLGWNLLWTQGFGTE